MPAMKILLLEPYCGGSHRAWAQGYAARSRHDVTLLTLPARFWKWRMQGGALSVPSSPASTGRVWDRDTTTRWKP
jgi:hypothetical protein